MNLTKTLNLKSIFLIAVFLISTFTAFNQTKSDAYKDLTAGLESKKNEDYKSAVTLLEKALTTCETVGTEADDIKGEVTKALPGTYFKYALSLYKSKDIDNAILNFEKAKESGEKYGNEQVTQKSTSIISKLYRSKGIKSYKTDDYDNALKYFDKSIEANPSSTKSYYYKAIIYKAKDDQDKFNETINKTIELATAESDEELIAKANKTAKNYYFNKAILANKAKNYTEAQSHVSKTLEFDKFEKAYYLQASLYNKTKEYNNALESVNKAIEISDPEAKEENAKLYYEKGLALVGLNKKAEACEALKQALYGKYKKLADYKMKQELKCQ